jgi:glutamate dehydrogenase
MTGLKITTADFPATDSFPEYVDPFTPPTSEEDSCSENCDMSPHRLPRTLELREDELSRGPSPQPTHISVSEINRGTGHRTLRSATVGYVAPTFAGKAQQKLEGT